ncbi:alpha-L-fucosidase [Agriterribacter sp.]|uniref:alpha-L-fucosidase n=1 Tax=Agriterribacter sp. TaxID=2821509 RepID=UPI002C472CDE|nr:alpha-L-fucosidase [Agriterribacter sp.]HRO45388.1 alpha-L-fucosidase [Agriterribacter sp.]HRQ16920.1 alpha-L-fucosidase [Agriterribacter sp.]
MIRSIFSALLLILLTGFYAQGQSGVNDNPAKMQWFKDAKLGIFIHWGIYSVNGVDESWSFHNKKISYADYMKQLNGFTAKNYNPDAWAQLIKETGARYAVITTKHHDGIALWDTKANNMSTAKLTPARKDVITPFFAALRNAGLKAGAYFSILDWSHQDYPGFLKDSSRYQVKDDPARWNRYLAFYQAQIKELSTQFNPDLFWFDGDWEHSAAEWQAKKVREMILAHNPEAIINGRLAGYGDYETPEQNFPITRPSLNPWELCMTSNNNWGYHPDDSAYKTPYELITIFADVISNGGNLLFDIGPREDGWIPTEQVHLLKELGKWTHKHEEAIFNTEAGMPPGHFYGPSTISKDSSTLYLFVPALNRSKLVIKGLYNTIQSIKVIGADQPLHHKIVGKISWSPVPGLVYIDEIPETATDGYMTVLEVKLDGPIKLYKGKGGLGAE